MFEQCEDEFDQLRGVDVDGVDVFQDAGEEEDDLGYPAYELGLGFRHLDAALQVPNGGGIEVQVVPDELFDYIPDLLVFETVEYDVYQYPHVLLVEEELLDAEERRYERLVVFIKVESLDHAYLVPLYLVEKILNEGHVQLFPRWEVVPETALGKARLLGHVLQGNLGVHILLKAAFQRLDDVFLFLDDFEFFFHCRVFDRFPVLARN